MSRRVAARRVVKGVWPGAGATASLNRASPFGGSGAQQTRNRVSYPWPGRRPANPGWRPEPIDGSKSRDELWVGVKCQPNPEIAGSPRNAFRGSRPRGAIAAVGHWMGEGPFRLPTPTKPRRPRPSRASEAVGAKLHGREGNNPDRQLRPRSSGSVAKDVRAPRQPGGWLRSSHPLKSA
jgi:hypothetical protein